jgi:hypothetical protein
LDSIAQLDDADSNVLESESNSEQPSHVLLSPKDHIITNPIRRSFPLQRP